MIIDGYSDQETEEALRLEIARLTDLLSVGMYYVCSQCGKEKDKRSEECTATKWKERYDKKCQENKRLKELLDDLTRGQV